MFRPARAVSLLHISLDTTSAKFVLVVSCRAASGSDRQCPLVETFLVIPRVFATSTSIRVDEAAALPAIICAIWWENRGMAKTCRAERTTGGATETSEGSHLFFISIYWSTSIDRCFAIVGFFLPFAPASASLLSYTGVLPNSHSTFLIAVRTAAGTGYRVTLQKANRREFDESDMPIFQSRTLHFYRLVYSLVWVISMSNIQSHANHLEPKTKKQLQDICVSYLTIFLHNIICKV